MPLVSIDPEKCKHDGLCVADCPMGLFNIPEKDKPPVLVPGAEELCIRCGHCVAVCPHAALTHEAMGPEDCREIPPDQKFSPDQAENFLRFRRSCRNYKKKPVERELIQRLIEIARYAPSGHNSQPVEWLVVHDTEKVHALSGEVIAWCRYMLEHDPTFARGMHMDILAAAWDMGFDAILRNAPHLVVTHAPADSRMAPDASTLALGYLELAAPSLGLGTCMAGYFTAATRFWPPMKKALGLPENHACFGAVMLGYPAFGHFRCPTRNAPTITWK